MYKKAFALISSQGLVTLVNIIIVMFSSRWLSQIEYSSFRQSLLLYETIGPLLTLGIPATVFFLLPKFANKRILIFHCSILIIIVGLLFAFGIWVGLNEIIANQFNNSLLIPSYNWLAIYPIFHIISQLLTSLLIFENKTKKAAIALSVGSVIQLFLVSLATYITKEALFMVAAKVISQFFCLLILIIYTKKLKSFIISSEPLKFKWSIVNQILKTSIPFGMASVISIVSLQIDKIMVSKFESVSTYGIYINGAMEIPLIGIITGSIAAVLVGEMSKKVEEGDFFTASTLFKLAANRSSLILFPVFCFLLFYSQDFIITIYSNKYLESYIPLTIYLFLIPIRIVMYSSALIALGKSKTILVRALVELFLNIILSFILYKLYGIWAIAVATILVTYLWSVPFNIYEISKGFKVRLNELFDFKFLFRVILVCFIVAMTLSRIDIIKTKGFVRLVTFGGVYCLIITFLYVKFNFIPNNWVGNRIRKK